MTFQVSESTGDFWNSLNLKWQSFGGLPQKYWVLSVAILNRNVYAAVMDYKNTHLAPLMYDSNEGRWSSLTTLPNSLFSLVTVPDEKQLLAIGGVFKNGRRYEVSSKVFVWDEENRKWITPYPNMSTARFRCSSISHGSKVIVAGGVTCWDPWMKTRAVEVLYITKRYRHSSVIRSCMCISRTYDSRLQHDLVTSYRARWSVVEQLPHVVYDAIPLIVDDKLYIAQGFDGPSGASNHNVTTASLKELSYGAKF